MEYRTLGDSDVKVSVVTLGTWAIGGWLWGGQDKAEGVTAIERAVDVGITSIDTAPMYGYGRSEETVGEAVKGRRDKVQILTKYCLRWDCTEGEHYFDSVDLAGDPTTVHRNGRADSVVLECERSLKRLQTDYIDLYQCHWRDNTTPVEETMTAIEKLLKAGKIRAAGVSNFTVEDIAAARAVVPLASNQPPYSMLRRDAEADILPYCREHNIGVVVYSPLQLGLLTGKVSVDREFPDDDLRARNKLFTPANRRAVLAYLDDIRPIAEAHNATLAQLVIAWTLRQPGVTAALVGARKPEQAAENAKAGDITLTDQDIQQINERLDKLELER